MAKKRPLFGVSNYVKRTRKKRPRRHTKRINKNKSPRKKRYRGQGRWQQLTKKLKTFIKCLISLNDHELEATWYGHENLQKGSKVFLAKYRKKEIYH